MQFDALRYALWVLATLLLAWVCGLILYRRAHHRLPLFALYAGVNLAQNLGWWTVAHTLGVSSHTAYYFYWITQGIVLVARGGAIAELCYRILRAYRGIWGLAWRVLGAVSAGLIVYAGVAASRQTYWIHAFVTTADRGVEFAAASTLVVLLGFTAYYRIGVPSLERAVALAFAFYSLVTVGLDAMMLVSYKSDFLYSVIQSTCYALVLALWLRALRKPLAAEAPAPQLIGPEVYGELTPQLNYRLELLNNRLLEILRS